MNPKPLIASMVLAIFIFLTATTLAQPVPDGQYPSGPDYPGPNYPNYPNDPNYPNYPGPQNGPEPTPGPVTCQAGYHYDYNVGTCVADTPGPTPDVSGSEHPAEGPQVAVPTYTPSANNGKVLGNLGDGQTLDTQGTIAAFGSEPGTSSDEGAQSNGQRLLFAPPPPPNGIQIWVFYNNHWTQGPSAVFLNQQMNIAVRNGQSQFLWGYDSNSWQMWSSWGLRWPGTMFSTFLGDVRGWHMVAMWGSKSGWSNVLPIYVL
jgi:hypothetical protein